jgi:transposase
MLLSDCIGSKCFCLKEKIDLLKTIERIGDKTACILLSEMLMIDNKPVNSKAQTAYAGLDLAHRLSGSSLKGKSRISATGNAKLRKALYMPALCCVSKKNGCFHEFYKKLTTKGKPKKVALTAVMRKLLATANGVLLNNKPFQPDWAEKKQKEFLIAA